MTLSPEEALQKAIAERLLATEAVTNIVEDRVSGRKPKKFPALQFGPSQLLPEEMDCITAETHSIQIDGYIESNGSLLKAKTLMGAVMRALQRVPLDLGAHALADMEITDARTFRESDGIRSRCVIIIKATVEVRGG